MTKPISLWNFSDAPEHLQALSPHGGDEDWLSLVPTGVNIPWWMDEDAGTCYGCCSISHTKTDEGTVIIGAHA